MIDTRIKLNVVYAENGSYTDHSSNACDYARDTFDVQLQASQDDYLYVGFYKPIGAVYCEIETANNVNNELVLEYYQGSSWVTVPTFRDETKDFQRSGFIHWTKPDDWKQTSVNGQTKYWVRINATAQNSNVTFRGINLVFCDDSTLKQEFADIVDPRVLPQGQQSHILSHVAARNEIVRELRNRGYIKATDNGEENITQWDLLDIFEIQDAAKFKALSNIFFSLSDSLDDHWYRKHEEYLMKYKRALSGLRLSVDLNDNGQTDRGEKLKPIKITRLIY